MFPSPPCFVSACVRRCFFLHRPRLSLYDRIAARVEDMVCAPGGGLLEEAALLLRLGLQPGDNMAAKAIGGGRGVACRGVARSGVAWCGVAWRGVAWRVCGCSHRSRQHTQLTAATACGCVRAARWRLPLKALQARVPGTTPTTTLTPWPSSPPQHKLSPIT